MIGGNVNVNISRDRTRELLESLRSLAKIDVLVGIPEENSSRNGGKITNAELAFIHTEGSPLNHIPPRPFVEPAISDPENRERIMNPLHDAAGSALDGNIEKMSRDLVAAGVQAQNAVRDWFTNPRNGWPPNSPYTILQKLRKKKTGIARDIVRYVDEGGSLSDILGIDGLTRVLIDTDQLRKAVSFTIREKD